VVGLLEGQERAASAGRVARDQPAPALFFERLGTDELDDVGVGGTGTVKWFSDDEASASSRRTSLARTDGAGIPPAVTLTAGHRSDITQLLPLLDAVGPLAGKAGRPRKRPNRVIADRGYDRDKHRREVWRRGVKPVIARRRTEHGSGLGRERWVVERTFAWLHQFRRLRIRCERDPDQHVAFMHLAGAVICRRRLESS